MFYQIKRLEIYFRRQVDIKTGKLMIGRHMGELREGVVYSGGKKKILKDYLTGFIYLN